MRSQRHTPAILWGALISVVLVGGQVVLGGVTVLNDLPSSMVMAHLALAATLLATLVIVALESFALQPPGSPPLAGREGMAPFRNLALLAAVATFGLMLTGSYVTGTGASLAFRDWPLFDGRLLPDGGRLAVIHATHRLAAAAVGLLLLYLAVRAWRSQRWHIPILLGSTIALALYGAQVLVGAANIWTLLQPAAIAAHLALAVALWSMLVAVGLFAHRAEQRGPDYERMVAIETAPRRAGSSANPPREGPVEPASGTFSARGPS